MKPILFNTEMVKAILEGRKISTRRITKFRPYTSLNETTGDFEICESETQNFFRCLDDFIEWAIAKCRYKVGDILYVRETWCQSTEIEPNYGKQEYHYKASSDDFIRQAPKGFIKWKPSIHMPKVAARIFLKVTDIKAQQIQDITEDEALKEGITEKASYDEYTQEFFNSNSDNYKYGFGKLWNSCGYKWPNSWSGNPWVWVIEFQRV